MSETVGVRPAPKAVLICHREDRIDSVGLASWLAHTFQLVGMVVLDEQPHALLRRAKREFRRSGLIGFADVLAFRAYYALSLRRSDSAWIEQEIVRLKETYPADLNSIPQFVGSNPNAPEVAGFLKQLRPDLVIAKCKVLLRPEIFDLPRYGTFVFHPGFCPEYRNAHGCFWALANRDLGRVGMSLLGADRGVDTGPLYFQATCTFDEARESHVIIQHRAVLENLDSIRDALFCVCNGGSEPIATEGRRSGVWGQPRLSTYLRWKRAARKNAS